MKYLKEFVYNSEEQVFTIVKQKGLKAEKVKISIEMVFDAGVINTRMLDTLFTKEMRED